MYWLVGQSGSFRNVPAVLRTSAARAAACSANFATCAGPSSDTRTRRSTAGPCGLATELFGTRRPLRRGERRGLFSGGSNDDFVDGGGGSSECPGRRGECRVRVALVLPSYGVDGPSVGSPGLRASGCVCSRGGENGRGRRYESGDDSRVHQAIVPDALCGMGPPAQGWAHAGSVRPGRARPGPVADQIELLATSEDDFTRWCGRVLQLADECSTWRGRAFSWRCGSRVPEGQGARGTRECFTSGRGVGALLRPFLSQGRARTA
jgi:hypothetical protein